MALTHNEWLAKAEDQWGPRLRQVGLVAGLDVKDKVSVNAARSLGLVQRRQPRDIERILRTRPAAVILAFTGAAVDGYRGGSFWPQFWDRCDVDADHVDQLLWGRAFLNALGHFGLPTFPNESRTYLGPMLMHAGVPTYCLPDYFRVLLQGMRAVGSDADALVAWASSRADTSLANIDRPVIRFLQYGSDYAVDFVDRSLDLLGELSSGGDGTSVELPERILEAARRTLDGQAIVPLARDRARPAQASLRLDPYSGQLSLSLPALADVDDLFSWRVSADGIQHSVRPRQALGGRRIGSQEASWQIDRPVRLLGISAGDLARQQEIVLFEDGDPVVFFDESGAMVARHLSLPASSVWALFRAPEKDGSLNLESLVRVEEQAPLGWTGWRLALLDLQGREYVQLTAGGPRRAVRVQSRAWLSDGEVLPWCRAGGLPLNVTRPVLHLPDSISAPWTVTVTDSETGRQLSERVVSSHAESSAAIDPFEGLPAPLVGRFEVAAKGPLGRGVSRTVVLAEGLQTDPAEPWRSVGRGGLEPASIGMIGDDLTCDPSVLDLKPDEDTGSVQVHATHQTLSVQVTPPAMAVAAVTGGVAGRWIHGHVRIAPDALVEGQLVVRTPPNGRVSWLRAVVAGSVAQEVPPERGGDAAYRVFPLAGLTATVSVVGTCDLTIEIDGKQIRVARIEPKQIATGANVEGSSVQLQGFTGGDVRVRVWTLFEPWEKAVDLTLDQSGACELPTRLLGRGPLCLTWLRYDPWLWEEATWLPHDDDFQLVEAPVDPSVASPAVIGLSSRSTDVDPLPLAWAWSLLGMARRVDQSDLPWPVVQALSRGLAADPVRAFEALSECPASIEDRLAILLQSGVAWARTPEAPVEFSEREDEHLRALVLRDPVSASLVAVPHLIQGNAPAQIPGTWATASVAYGREFTEILCGRPDPAARDGGFRMAGPLSHLPEETVVELLARLRVVPRSVLDGDSRVKASYSLFQSRNDSRLRSPSREARAHLNVCQEILRERRFSEALQLIDFRDDSEHGGGWVALSALSAGFALMARLSARGESNAGDYLARHFGRWLALARVAPDHVALDLVLAEAMVAAFTAQEHPEVAGETGQEEDA